MDCSQSHSLRARISRGIEHLFLPHCSARKIALGPGLVAQLVRESSPYAKVVGWIPGVRAHTRINQRVRK